MDCLIIIDKEPLQLVELRKAYEAELKTAATPDDLAKLQDEYEQAKKNLAKAEGYAQKLPVLEEAKKKVIEAITAKYLKEQEKVDVATRKSIDEKYEKSSSPANTGWSSSTPMATNPSISTG